MATTRRFYPLAMPYFLQVLPELNPDCRRLALLCMQSFLGIGPQVIGELWESGVIPAALDLIANASFKLQQAAVTLLAGICFWVGDPVVEQFILEHNLVVLLVDFLGTSGRSAWSSIMEGLARLLIHVSEQTDEIMGHPLFAAVDADELYDRLIDMHARIPAARFPGLYANVLNFLHVFEPSDD
jgi:hypothetical protein